jgi:hypothetical protein
MYQGGLLKPEEAMHKSKASRDSMSMLTVYTQLNRRPGEASKYKFRFNRRRYEAKSITIFPSYLDSNDKRLGDLALIELTEAVTNTSPAVLNKTFNELGDTFTAVGFGVSGIASLPEEVDRYHTKLAGQNIIDTLTGGSHGQHPTLLGYDFDKPGDTQYNLYGNSLPLPLEHICGGGDSGGGMFRETANGWELIGICTGSSTDVGIMMKTGYYGQSATYTRVSVFYDWIRKGMN